MKSQTQTYEKKTQAKHVARAASASDKATYGSASARISEEPPKIPQISPKVLRDPQETCRFATCMCVLCVVCVMCCVCVSVSVSVFVFKRSSSNS